MRKIFLLSFDDGTIYDKGLVELLNKHQIPGTFNLNSGLEDFVWEFEGREVLRQCISDTVEQYRGHEIASHTLHHPLLTSLEEQTLCREVGEDCENLRRIFGVEELPEQKPAPVVFTCDVDEIEPWQGGLKVISRITHVESRDYRYTLDSSNGTVKISNKHTAETSSWSKASLEDYLSELTEVLNMLK